MHRESIEPAQIPNSVRSFSCYSSDNYTGAYPLYDARVSSLDDNDHRDSFLPNGLSRARDSLASPPTTPTLPQYPISRSRSPLAGPPSYSQCFLRSPTETVIGSPDPTQKSLMKGKERTYFKSNALLDLDRKPLCKPWIGKKDFLAYVSYWLTWSMVLFMASTAALSILVSMSKLEEVGDLCLILDDNFDKGLDRNTWFHEVDMGGFGFVSFLITGAEADCHLAMENSR